MRKRVWIVVLVCVAQSVAVGLGVAWGLGAAHGVGWLHGHWLFAGGLAVLLMSIEGLRRLASRRLRTAQPLAPWICLALGFYAGLLMVGEAFLRSSSAYDFIRSILLMLPFLLVISPLVRSGFWLGVLGSALFFTTSLAMLTCNGFSRNVGFGFFGRWVS